MLRKNRKSGSERHAATRRRGLLMAAADLPAFAIIAGLLLPALAAAAWAITLERRPRRATVNAEPDLEPDWTVAGIEARLRFEQSALRLSEAGTIALPTMPIPEQTSRDSSPDRLPWRVPRTIPPAGPQSGRVPVSRFAFAPPDSLLMRRILDGLRNLD
ncbi:hypothetical protein AB0C38_33210 [Amycolatopsis sp. NPDC048633]|uniref:hypothetical protein n=1 Tax=Amycolatopsis sp. NPDC048633 TaxID=3157095 RepID=UPI0033EA1F6E